MPTPQGDIRLAPLGGPGPGVRRVVLVVVAFLAIAIAKPWAWASAPDGLRPAPDNPTTASPVVALPPTAANRTSAPFRLAGSVLLTSAGILRGGTAPTGGDVACWPSTGWRVATVDGTGVDRLRTWYNLVPGWGAGPTDPAIPRVRVFARDLVALGFCAPTTDGQSIALAGIRGWQVDGGRAVPIDLARLAGSSPRDLALGSLFGAPPPTSGGSSNGGGAWPDGRFVFLIQAGQADQEDIWFGVDTTRIVDARSGGAPPIAAPGSAAP